MTEPTVVDSDSYTTSDFDQDFSGKLSLLFTEDTVSWISSKPISYYDAPKYLKRQFYMQCLVAAFLISILSVLRAISWRRQIGVVSLAALTASASTYGALWNWWGLPPAYAIGESFNLICGWLIAALIGYYFLNIFGSRKRSVFGRTAING